MAKHHLFLWERFIGTVEPVELERYFERVPEQNRPTRWGTINGQALQQFFARPENAEVGALVEEDFQRMNDVAQDGASVLMRAYQKHGIEIEGERSIETLALTLFVDHPTAFEFAWSRYLVYGSDARLSTHPMLAGDLRPTQEQVLAFQSNAQAWFADQGKGERCYVQPYEDQGEIALVIRHGTHMRTLPILRGDLQETLTVRLAIDDVVIYDSEEQLIRIRAGLPKDREHYLRGLHRGRPGPCRSRAHR